ncbi:metallophosphoesterase [Deltaproteobacteria bacterium Smac51]|nr:metallophosphoesterase [Deltaproteobacteria bacterium Smac51]
MTRILFLGDIFGKTGRQVVRDFMPKLVGEEAIDLAIANGENASGGLGLNPGEAQELFGLGLAVLTGGNHTFRYKDTEKMLDKDARLVRPANYPEPCPGRGWTMAETAGGVRVGIGNLMGRVFINASLDCPFQAADRIIEEMKTAGAQITLIDFHAETTSEKRAMSWYVDGRLGALLGTHTHVQTADADLMPGGLAYMTDVGMCGPHNSVIGMSRDTVLPGFLSGRPKRFEAASKGARLNGVIIDFDDSGRATSIKALNLKGVK